MRKIGGRLHQHRRTMKKLLRPSAIIRQQIAHFKAILPDTGPLPSDDFATELQWRSWQTHLAELNAELKASLEYEEREKSGNLVSPRTTLTE